MAAVQLGGQTDVYCKSCGEDLLLEEETYLATVCYAVPNGDDGVQYFTVIDEEGGYRYEPYFFDLTCWTEVDDGLKELLEDTRPVEHPDELLACSYCCSSILPLEVFAHIQFGELRHPARRPPGARACRFHQIGERTWAICLSCMTEICEHVLEIWGDVSQGGECGTCQHARCWRDDECELGCDCHDEEEEELYERGDRVVYTDAASQQLRLRQLPVPSIGVVQADQESGEEEVEVVWSDGSRGHIHCDNIEPVE